MAEVGLTTTIPVEAILAAGETPVDLNNIFITDPDPQALVNQAELDGYPRNACGWIKGIYAAALRRGIEKVVAVTQGDCSQTHALMETLQAAGVEIIPFAYPYDRDRQLLAAQIQRFMDHFGVNEDQVQRAREKLRPVRELVGRIDELTWKEGKVAGAENHYYQVCCSDFNGDVETFFQEAQQFYQEASQRPARQAPIRLGFMGVPPIITDLYEFTESRGAPVIFNETQRQFTMIDSLDEDLVTQYQRYTYPYDVFGRIADVNRQVKLRRLDGVIHYTQTFCFRQIEDLLIRPRVNCPVLSLEGDRPGPIDARNKLRLEAFVEMLSMRGGQPS